MGIVQE